MLLIHGGILADAFFPLLAEPRIASNYRVISYHRRGFAGSARATPPFSTEQQVADARALLHHLSIDRAHVVGHSYGGAIALQWAKDVPDEIHSLALLEAPLLSSIPSAPMFWDGVAALKAMYEQGQRVAAVEAFCAGVAGPAYRELIDTALPPGAFDLAIADVDTFFQVESEALKQWQFSAEAAGYIHHPVLAMAGSESAPIFQESHELLKRWLPQSEEVVVQAATHALPFMNPRAVAEGLARFLAEHPL